MPSDARPSADEPRRRILVIDDERGPRESLRMLLKTEYEVQCAESVDAGLAALKAFHPDTVIMDIRMPVRNGIEGLREIRQRDQDTAVVMLTGFGDLETAREAIRLGANDYIRKPFDAKEMTEVVRLNVTRTTLNRRREQDHRELEDLTAQLRRDLDERARLAAMGLASSELVHDIRNPLTIIMGYFDLLHAEIERTNTADASNRDAMEYLSSIKRNLMRCTDLMESWRALGNRAALSLQPVELPAFLSELARESTGPAALIQPTLDFATDCRNDHVLADRVQLRRAVQNILQNALQAVPADGGRVTLALRREGADSMIVVSDNGCGIPAEVLPRVFEPFYTTRIKNKGTGLGLFIARQVIEDHGGKLDIASQPDAGTTVSIRLPRAN